MASFRWPSATELCWQDRLKTICGRPGRAEKAGKPASINVFDRDSNSPPLAVTKDVAIAASLFGPSGPPTTGIRMRLQAVVMRGIEHVTTRICRDGV